MAVRQIQDLFEKFLWDVFRDPPYFPDLAPSNFHLYLQLKQHLDRRRFVNKDDLIEVES